MRKDYLKDWDTWNSIAVKLYFEPKSRIAAREVDNLLRLLFKAHGAAIDPRFSKVLDLGAGWGRHSLELAKRGFGHVSAVDASPVMESLFRREFLRAAIADLLTYAADDFFDWAQEQRPDFDLVLVLWSMFGVCRHDDVNCDLLRTASGLLKTGGRIVIETLLRDRLSDALQTSVKAKALFTFDSSVSQAEHWEIKTWEDRSFLILGSAELVEDGTVLNYALQELPLGRPQDTNTLSSGTISLRYYDLRELVPMLSQARFAVEAIAGPLGNPEDRGAPRGTIIARKLP